jgi:hypothetical protein
VEAFDRAWSDRSAVLVEASDLARADMYATVQTEEQADATRAAALQDAAELVGALLRRVDPARDAVVVLGPAPPATDRSRLTVAAVSAPGVHGGLLRSPTTQRTGYVQLMDVAPSLLDALGVARPDSMRGRPVESVGGGTYRDRRDALVDADAAAHFRAEIRDPLTIGFVVAQVVLCAAAAFVLLRRARTAGVAGVRAVIVIGALAVLGTVTAVYLARMVPLHDAGAAAYFGFVTGVGIALGVATWLVTRREPLDAVVLASALIVAVLVLDVVTGSTLQLSSGFGFSPEVAGRFIGYGNISYAFLGAAAVLLAGLLAHRLGGRAGAWIAIGVLAVAVLADGAPFWGADVGGVLTMVPAYAVTAVLLLGRPIRIRSLAVLAGVTAVAIALAAVVDSLRPAGRRTHLGRLVEQVGDEGTSAFATVIQRKLEMNVQTLSSSEWRAVVVVGVAFVLFLALSRARHLTRLLARVPELRASLVGLLIVAVLGYALNDQGIVVPAAMLAILAPVLVVLVVPVAPDPAAERTARAGSTARTPVDARGTQRGGREPVTARPRP